ncbi:hypothetical protein EA658_16560 [Pseudoxanthomonas winnipegensis]|uniref:DUF1737 domain-containing protein n=1 Tax=Pseudoxanthomonas winnipegensis TaxID=2480810 RepID=A0ABY1WCG2_9GAMM|nr:hypothetical protein [Pseudoxanthomonas winnipegensis]TAA11275.1 hypothetical protein EA659_07975 [Pseudoxanthomonas winnipegensis]TAA18698.1 hypothetical protein EA658_16560 [Pseudoxanthomonas winnipegensis]TAH73926.1 hypothetical protein EA657_00185 [Pseudoxanthomonas winnipegensis]
MHLSTIVKVAHTHIQEDVNQMLRDGWVLLASEGGTDEEGYPIFWHALGLPGRSIDEAFGTDGTAGDEK